MRGEKPCWRKCQKLLAYEQNRFRSITGSLKNRACNQENMSHGYQQKKKAYIWGLFYRASCDGFKLWIFLHTWCEKTTVRFATSVKVPFEKKISIFLRHLLYLPVRITFKLHDRASPRALMVAIFVVVEDIVEPATIIFSASLFSCRRPNTSSRTSI